MVIDEKVALKLANKYRVDLNIIPLDIWQYGLNVELEHGTRNKITNITKDDVYVTAKIALAHLIEFPDYYQRLRKMESEAEDYWSKKNKPLVIKQSGGKKPNRDKNGYY